jgi:hypothetical protein
MMKKSVCNINLLVVSILGLAIAAPSFALTVPALQISDGTNTFKVDSTGVIVVVKGCAPITVCSGTSTPGTAGSFSWSGTVGAFTILKAAGRSKPALAQPQIDLSSSVGSLTGGTLTIAFTDTGFTEGANVATLSTTTSTMNGSSATFAAYFDLGNQPFIETTQIGSLNVGSAVNAPAPPGPGPNTNNPFSLTEVETFVIAPVNGALGQVVTDESLTVQPAPLSLTCPTASGTVGTFYSSNAVANGGSQMYTFAITSNLTAFTAAGLSLNAMTGAITGTPVTSSPFTFTIQVTDTGYNTTASASCGFTATPMYTPPSLSCPTATTGQVGTYYSSSFVAVPSGSYTFGYTGNLPSPLTLNQSTGSLTGTPSSGDAGKTYTFTGSVTVNGSGKPPVYSPQCTITIGAPPPQLSFTCATSTGSVGVPYSSSIVASGGVKPYVSYSATGLPPGLMINSSTGAITGTPTSPGTFSIKVTVKDSNGDVASSSCSGGCTITITCTVLGTISGYVYDDLNASKTYNSGDKAFGGVTVTLTGGGKTVTTTSNSSGFYSFSSLALGNYVVSAPSSIASANETIDTPTSINVNLNANNPSCYTTCQTSSTNNDFGYVGTSTVSGKCYTNDYWGGNHSMGGQPVTVSGKDCFGHQVSKTTTTDGNGNYSCSGLYPGSYTVSAPSQCNWQGGYHTIQTNSSYNVGCQSGDSHPNLNFCYNWGW